MDILENDLCVRFWRVPFVVLVFTAFVFVSGAWGACVPANLSRGTNAEMFCAHGSNCSKDETNCVGEGSCEVPCDSTTSLYGEYYTAVTLGASRCVWIGFGEERCGKYWGAAKYSNCIYTLKCSTQCEADSVVCVNKGGSYGWNSANCTCDSIGEPDTTYRCQNGFIGSQTAGMRPIATLYRCVSTGSSSDQCVQTGSLNGTCQ